MVCLDPFWFPLDISLLFLIVGTKQQAFSGSFGSFFLNVVELCTSSWSSSRTLSLSLSSPLCVSFGWDSCDNYICIRVFFFLISLDWSGSRKTRECLAWRKKGTGNTQVPSQLSLRSSLSFFPSVLEIQLELESSFDSVCWDWSSRQNRIRQTSWDVVVVSFLSNWGAATATSRSGGLGISEGKKKKKKKTSKAGRLRRPHRRVFHSYQCENVCCSSISVRWWYG